MMVLSFHLAKKEQHRKDGSFWEDKSNGIMKFTICSADEFLNAPNVNDLPEDADDPLDKHLPLQILPKIKPLIVSPTSPT